MGGRHGYGLQGSDTPAEFPERDRLFNPEEWINCGDAFVKKTIAGGRNVSD